MQLLFRLGLLIVCAWLGWRIIAVNVSDHYVGAMATGTGQSAAQALKWAPHHPDALYRAALDNIPADLEAARQQLSRAYQQNPTDPRPLLILAGLAQAEGALDQADEWVRLAAALRPVDSSLQADVARYWLDRRRFDLALHHWSAALKADPALRSNPRFNQPIFDRLRSMLAEDAGVDAFRPITANPPIWWDEFYADTAGHPEHTDILRLIYRMRRQSTAVPLTATERRLYVDRLLKDKHFGEAYLAWVNGLTAEQRKHLGPLYNGSFELPITNQGFDWQITDNDRVDIGAARVDLTERNALRLIFRVSRDPFNHLHQSLYLAKGPYEVSGTYKSANFYSDGGVRWIFRCLSPQPLVLAESERIFGAEEWTSFSFQVEIPDTCKQQELRLVSGGGSSSEQPVDGELWFDNLSIRRIPALAPIARMKNEIRQLNGAPAAPGL